MTACMTAVTAYLEGDVFDGLDAGPVEVVVVLPRLDEEMRLDVGLHLLDAGDEVVVPLVHLVLALGPRGVRHTGAEPLWELPHQVIIDPVLQGNSEL